MNLFDDISHAGKRILGAPNENDIQLRMSQIELARQMGQPFNPTMMDPAGQEALRRLMQQTQAQAQAQPQPQNNVWGAAEAEQKRRIGPTTR